MGSYYRYSFVIFKIYLFIYLWLHHEACRILILQSGIEPRPPAVEVRNPNHWTARELPSFVILKI